MGNQPSSIPGARPFGAWERRPPPDAETVAALYRDGMIQRDIAEQLGVPRRRVADALASAGVARRESGLECPLEQDELRRLARDGLTQQRLAERFDVASGTAGRWLAEAGIGDPDPRIDRDMLQRLYVDERQPVREVAAHFGVPHHRVVRELALAGIKRRSRHDRRPTGPRATVTDAALRELYVERGMNIPELCAYFGVSDEYLRKRLRECGLGKRPGTFGRRLARERRALEADAAELYTGAELGLREVAAALAVSSSEVRELLHEARVPLRPPGLPHMRDQSHRRLVEDLYSDPDVRAVLERFRVPVQDPERWTRPSPFETLVSLPLPAELVRELYEEVGLSGYHIALLCGVGTLLVMNRLRALEIPVRKAGGSSPWTTRTYS